MISFCTLEGRKQEVEQKHTKFTGMTADCRGVKVSQVIHTHILSNMHTYIHAYTHIRRQTDTTIEKIMDIPMYNRAAKKRATSKMHPM